MVVAPALPRAALWWAKRTDKTQGYKYVGDAAKKAGVSSSLKNTPTDNRLVIPSIQLDQPIKESKSISTISNGGAWRRPATSSPDHGGNTVVVGHRFTYLGKSTFTNLPDVKVGDVVVVFWNGKEIDYTVTATKVVEPNDRSIENQTNDQQLTLYTCTPMWTSKQRFVVIARPV